MGCCDTKYSVSEGGETYEIITKFAKSCTFAHRGPAAISSTVKVGSAKKYRGQRPTLRPAPPPSRKYLALPPPVQELHFLSEGCDIFSPTVEGRGKPGVFQALATKPTQTVI